MDEVKRRQVGFLLINESDPIAADMKQNSINWGVTALAESHGTTLYRIN
jgi:hypothetical protein